MKRWFHFFLWAILLAGWLITGLSPVVARPEAEATSTPYPYETDTPIPTLGPYPTPDGGDNPTNTAQPNSTQTTPTLLSSTGTPLPPEESATLGTPTLSLTPGRNLFGTEDAEMGGALVTPPPSETPLPTRTLTPTRTATPDADANSSLVFDQGWFVGGLVLPPALILAGWLIYRARRSGEFQ